MKALVIGNNESCHSVVNTFKQAGLSVVEAPEINSGLRHTLEDNPTIVVMSERVLPWDGPELLPTMKDVGNAPIIIIGTGGKATIIRAFILGADLYLTLPVGDRELLAYVRALLRRRDGA